MTANQAVPIAIRGAVTAIYSAVFQPRSPYSLPPRWSGLLVKASTKIEMKKSTSK
jgi:hypothetical protein